MVRNLEFHKREDTVRYLHRTICRYKQDFVYVTVNPYDAMNILEIQVQPFGGRKKTILTTDEDFSVYMPEIGYINTPEGSFYLKRRPARVQRAGLPVDMLSYHGRRPDSGIDYISNPEGHAMLQNDYPSFIDCSLSVSWEGLKHKAFHKHLCLAMPNRYSKVIEYKGEVAAILDSRSNEWYIPQPRQDTSFIKAILVRNGVPIK